MAFRILQKITGVRLWFCAQGRRKTRECWRSLQTNSRSWTPRLARRRTLTTGTVWVTTMYHRWSHQSGEAESVAEHVSANPRRADVNETNRSSSLREGQQKISTLVVLKQWPKAEEEPNQSTLPERQITRQETSEHGTELLRLWSSRGQLAFKDGILYYRWQTSGNEADKLLPVLRGPCEQKLFNNFMTVPWAEAQGNRKDFGLHTSTVLVAWNETKCQEVRRSLQTMCGAKISM